MRKPYFWKLSFCLSELHLALLGSSRSLPGQSWGPDGTQKIFKSGPKLVQKLVQNGIQFWVALGPILGPVLGSKTEVCPGHFFKVFRCVSGRTSSSTPSTSGLHIGGKCICFSSAKYTSCSKVSIFHWQNACHVHLGPILAPSWRHLALSWTHLGPFLAYLGLILASSWPSWPLLAPSWPLLGPVLANWSAILNPVFRNPFRPDIQF